MEARLLLTYFDIITCSSAGEEWRNMSAQQKKPYENRSAEAGKKYEIEMAEYRKVSQSTRVKQICLPACICPY